MGCAPTSTPSSPVSLILLFAEFFGKSHARITFGCCSPVSHARITFGCCSPSFALPFQVDPSQSLNEHALRVLNKPVKKKKTVKKKGQVDALLDSQLSMSSRFFDSQECAPTSTPSSPVSLISLFAEFFGKSHVRITFGCCSPSFALPFQVDPSQSQAINLSLPSKATDYHSKCTFMAACHAHACLTHAHMHVML